MLWGIIGVTSLSIYIEASFWPNWDGAWHQTMVRDTALTPTHIPMFYFFFPIVGRAGVGRIPVRALSGFPRFTAADKGFPWSFFLLIAAAVLEFVQVAFNEWGHSLWMSEEFFSVPFHWPFVMRMAGWRAACSRSGARRFCGSSRSKRRRRRRGNPTHTAAAGRRRNSLSRILHLVLTIRRGEAWRQHTSTAAAARPKDSAGSSSRPANAKYQWIDRTWDVVFWITAIFVVAGAADITKLLFAGDWDFWTDWKDPQWWPVVTAFATIIIPSALQYIQWAAWRFPTGATYTCVCLFWRRGSAATSSGISPKAIR